MEYRNVGKSGLKVSEIALGSWMTELRESAQVSAAERIINLAYQEGVNFFDCADAYSGGAAEQFLGKILKNYPRSSYVVSSKVFFPTGTGVTPFSPLAQGLLTGKYKKGQALPEGSRATHQADKQINRLLTEEHLDQVEKLSQVAKELGISLSVLSLAWILRKGMVCSVITGASGAEQLENNLKAAGYKIPEDALREIESILNFHRFERHVG